MAVSPPVDPTAGDTDVIVGAGPVGKIAGGRLVKKELLASRGFESPLSDLRSRLPTFSVSDVRQGPAN
jgi:hypothetical protein